MNSVATKSHKDLIVWQKAMDLVVLIYALTKQFPTDERFGLISQMRDAATSIPSNIAEGRKRGTRKDYRHFLIISCGSGAELETQLEISKRLTFGNQEKLLKANNLLTEIIKMLNTMIAAMSES